MDNEANILAARHIQYIYHTYTFKALIKDLLQEQIATEY